MILLNRLLWSRFAHFLGEKGGGEERKEKDE